MNCLGSTIAAGFRVRHDIKARIDLLELAIRANAGERMFWAQHELTELRFMLADLNAALREAVQMRRRKREDEGANA